MPDPQPTPAKTGTLTIRYRSGSRDHHRYVPADLFPQFCEHIKETNKRAAPPAFPFFSVSIPGGRGIIVNLDQIDSIEFVPDPEADDTRWDRENQEARSKFAKVGTHLPGRMSA